MAVRPVLVLVAEEEVLAGNDEDLASLGRQLTGHGLGVVLGGGGARGFAHIGLVRAMEQQIGRAHV